MPITSKQLKLHAKWLRGDADGQRLVLRGADLRGAVLRGADLSGAVLSHADLSGAFGFSIASDAAERLKAVAAAALADDNALRMDSWHACETTHCIAGWAIAQAGETGRLLETAMGAEIAGLMLLGVEAHKHFYDDNDTARTWLQEVLKR